MTPNRHGLSRDIPSSVKRAVRQASGFGCVLCGSSIYQYEHVDPCFVDAKEHDPSRIALLCPTHHQKVTAGMLSKQTVVHAMSDPFCLREGFSSDLFDFGLTHPRVTFAGMRLEHCRVPIMVCGVPLFSIAAPEKERSPFLLSADFFDSSGRESLRIRDNEWQALASNWDVEVSGGVITVREALGKISLALCAEPPTGVVVERLDMRVGDYHFSGSANELTVTTPLGATLSLTGNLSDGSDVGLELGEPR